jgi:serine/threonine protein kinase
VSGRYEIKEQIGRGGLGVVYRAFDSHLDREVAIKRVLAESGEPLEELTANLLQEAKTLSALKHPHIVTVHDVGRDEEGPFVVMELLEGETLDAIIDRGALTIDDFEVLAIQTLEGLIAAQSVNLLHRDLKPTNIMVVWLPSGKFQVKILDFGLAKFSRMPTTQTVDHGDSIFGSIYFMAPEQFERTPLDVRTDLYSTGAIFYYTLTGKYPFRGANAVEVMTSHIEHRFTPLKKVRSDLPESVCNWIEMLMARKMEDRPANAQAALDAWNPVSAIDEEQLREAASNDPGLAAELLAGFIDEIGGLIEQMHRELESGQGTAAEETARTIRGTASTLGYSEIIAIASQIEEYAQADPEICRKLSGRFSPALARLEEAVGRMSWAG